MRLLRKATTFLRLRAIACYSRINKIQDRRVSTHLVEHSPRCAGATMTNEVINAGISRALLAELGTAIDDFELKTIIEKAANDEIEAFYWAGVILGNKKEFAMADRLLSRVTTLRPRHARAWNNLGSLALRRGDAASAKEAFESAIALNPDLYEPYCNLGVLHHEQGDVSRAVHYFERAEQISPREPVMLCNLAMARWERGEYTHARETIKDCVAWNRDHMDAKYIESFMALAYSEFEEGWCGYKYRNGRMPASRQLKIPVWSGEDLAHRTILVTPEQGLGEQILFSSCLHDLINLGARCIVVCTDKLKGLLQKSFPKVVVLGIEDSASLSEYGQIDFQVSIADLGAFFRTNRDTFTIDKGYLKVDSAQVEAWQAELLTGGIGLNIGISWRGGSVKTGGAARSIPLIEWSPILRIRTIKFFDLQYGDHSDEVDKVERDTGLNLVQCPVSLNDYGRLAEFISALDLIICVDTSIAYLNSGLGKTTWILLPPGPSWPYQVTGTRSPWFPCARIYRGHHPNDWRKVIQQVAVDLIQFTC